MKNYLIFSLTLVICFPGLFSYFAPLLILALICQILFRPNRLSRAINQKIILGFLTMLIASIFLVMLNVFKFGDESPWTYWIAGFLVWLVIVILIRSMDSPAEVIHKSLLCSSLFVGISCFTYVILFTGGILPEPVSFAGYQAYFGIDERGFFAYSTTHVPHIPYLLAYLVTYGALKKDAFKPLEMTAVTLLVISGLLSLRSFVAISFLGVLFYFVCIRKKWTLFIASIMILLAAGFSIYYASEAGQEILGGIYNLKWREKISGEDIRYLQLFYWLNSFLESPLFGHGLTSVRVELYDIATGELEYSRPGPIDAPYGYEIYYGKLLSDIGLFFFIYVAVFFQLSFSGKVNEENKFQLKALRFSALVMILQSATNTYLGTSGWMFILMLPMMLSQYDRFFGMKSESGCSQRLCSAGFVSVPDCDETLSSK